MPEIALEQLVEERRFVGFLQEHSDEFFRLTNALLASRDETWSKKHYFQIVSEADALETFLDDYGARYNRTYSFFTELIASLRGFGHAGYSLVHLDGRLGSYHLNGELAEGGIEWLRKALAHAADFVRRSILDMLVAVQDETKRLGLAPTTEGTSEENFRPVVAKMKLPHNVGDAELVDERQKIAEVAARYLRACEMLRAMGCRRIDSPEERRRFLAHACSEERARFCEATVHNLQSTYDTYVKNTVLESRDPRLGVLRGHASAALHLLEAVTHLTHFYERHESDIRSEAAKLRIAMIVDRQRVQATILNELLVPAIAVMDAGLPVAEALLPEYTNRREFVAVLPADLELHARPASLIVGIVNHYGTPVEMEIAGKRCNAASILELLVTVGSHPGERRFVFRGDDKPLADIERLFAHELGEGGIESLPRSLDYLRSR